MSNIVNSYPKIKQYSKSPRRKIQVSLNPDPKVFGDVKIYIQSLPIQKQEISFGNVDACQKFDNVLEKSFNKQENRYSRKKPSRKQYINEILYHKLNDTPSYQEPNKILTENNFHRKYRSNEAFLLEITEKKSFSSTILHENLRRKYPALEFDKINQISSCKSHNVDRNIRSQHDTGESTAHILHKNNITTVSVTSNNVEKIRNENKDILESAPYYDKKRRVSELMEELLLNIYGKYNNLKLTETEYVSSCSLRSFSGSFGMQLQFSRLAKKDENELNILITELKNRIVYTGNILVKYLKKREALSSKREKLCNVITAHLHAFSSKTTEDTHMRFSPNPIPGDSGFNQWRDAMRMVAKLPGGIPPEFRKKLWLSLAEKHLQKNGVNWTQTEKFCFNEWCNPDDTELGVQIVKDLHRTGCSLFCGAAGQENQALLKRVLLAYARWNKNVGYCQGFNMLAALILQVMDRNEVDSVKVMIYLIEGVLPESYFANNLRGLSVDMIVFRDLLKVRLPHLSRHLELLQNDAREGNSFEPPLTNVFTMQWFLTLFCNCLPQQTVLRVWDLIFLEGNEILLRTGIAIWERLSDRILMVNSADEFYSIMGVLTREMLEFGFVDSNTLVKSIVNIGVCAELNEMRDKYLYNITPWTQTVHLAAKKHLRLFYSDDDFESSDNNENQDVLKRKKSLKNTSRPAQQTEKTVNNAGNVSKSNIVQSYGHPDRERLALDISVLKKQYAKLKQRQRQAHVIVQAACARQIGETTSNPPIAMNHLLLGKNAIVNSRGRRLGPPKGSIPPARHSQTHTDDQDTGETIRWKDKKSKKFSDDMDDSNVTVVDDDSSSYEDSSSTSTELCDEDRLSDFDLDEKPFIDQQEEKSIDVDEPQLQKSPSSATPEPVSEPTEVLETTQVSPQQELLLVNSPVESRLQSPRTQKEIKNNQNIKTSHTDGSRFLEPSETVEISSPVSTESDFCKSPVVSDSRDLSPQFLNPSEILVETDEVICKTSDFSPEPVDEVLLETSPNRGESFTKLSDTTSVNLATFSVENNLDKDYVFDDTILQQLNAFDVDFVEAERSSNIREDDAFISCNETLEVEESSVYNSEIPSINLDDSVQNISQDYSQKDDPDVTFDYEATEVTEEEVKNNFDDKHQKFLEKLDQTSLDKISLSNMDLLSWTESCGEVSVGSNLDELLENLEKDVVLPDVLPNLMETSEEEIQTESTNVPNEAASEDFDQFLENRVKLLKQTSFESFTKPREGYQRHKSLDEILEEAKSGFVFKQSSVDDSTFQVINDVFETMKNDCESSEVFDCIIQSPEQAETLENVQEPNEAFPQTETSFLKVEKQHELIRRNSERALKIIQENSMILHRILQQTKSVERDDFDRSVITKEEEQNSTDPPPELEEKLLDLDVSNDLKYITSPEETPSNIPKISVSEINPPEPDKTSFQTEHENIVSSQIKLLESDPALPQVTENSDSFESISQKRDFESSVYETALDKSPNVQQVSKELSELSFDADFDKTLGSVSSFSLSSFEHKDVEKNVLEKYPNFELSSSEMEQNLPSTQENVEEVLMKRDDYTSIDKKEEEYKSDLGPSEPQKDVFELQEESKIESNNYKEDYKYTWDSFQKYDQEKVKSPVNTNTQKKKKYLYIPETPEEYQNISVTKSEPERAWTKTKQSSRDIETPEWIKQKFDSRISFAHGKCEIVPDEKLVSKSSDFEYGSKRFGFGSPVKSPKHTKTGSESSEGFHVDWDKFDEKLKSNQSDDITAGVVRRKHDVLSDSYRRKTYHFDSDYDTKNEVFGTGEKPRYSRVFDDDKKFSSDEKQGDKDNNMEVSSRGQSKENLSLEIPTRDRSSKLVSPTTSRRPYTRSSLSLSIDSPPASRVDHNVSPEDETSKKSLSCLQFTNFRSEFPCSSKLSPICSKETTEYSPKSQKPFCSSITLPTLSPPRRRVQVKSPVEFGDKVFSPFPVQPATRQPKDVAIKLGLYKDYNRSSDTSPTK